MQENPRLEGNVRVPRQAAERGEMARQILEGRRLATLETEPPPPAPANAAAAPTEPRFTIEELLKAPSPEKDRDPQYWKDRCNMIEGFRRQDNARATERVRALESAVAELRLKNEELSKAPPPPPQRTADELARDQANRLKNAMHEAFSEEEIEALGEERAMALTRSFLKQGETLEAAIGKLRGELESVKSDQVKKTKDSEAEDFRRRESEFFDKLTEGFPTWQVVNGDQRWLAWLNHEDESSGLSRQSILDQHRRALNAGKIVKMLEAFVQSLSPAPRPATPPETPPGAPGTGVDNPAPGAEAPSNVRVLTSAEITEGFKRCSVIGKSRFSPEEEAAFRASVAYTMKMKGKA